MLLWLSAAKTGTRMAFTAATLSSTEVTEESEIPPPTRYRSGNAIQEKKTLDTLIQARDLKLYSAITDCGVRRTFQRLWAKWEKIPAQW